MNLVDYIVIVVIAAAIMLAVWLFAHRKNKCKNCPHKEDCINKIE